MLHLSGPSRAALVREPAAAAAAGGPSNCSTLSQWFAIACVRLIHLNGPAKAALVVELSRAGISFLREKNYEITYKGVILPHYDYADFVVWDKILLEAKAVEKLTDSHIKQVLNYLAASKLRLGLLVNFVGGAMAVLTGFQSQLASD